MTNTPAKSSVIPDSCSLFLIFSLRQLPPSSAPSKGTGSIMSGSMTSASTNALLRPWKAGADFDGAFEKVEGGEVGRGDAEV